MSYPKPKKPPEHDRDPKQEQEQSQDQKQDQHQSQWQFALNDNKNENENENENKNENENSLDNKVDNDLDNKVDNKLDNSVDNKVDNDIKNEISNKVETTVDVDVKVDLDLDLDLDRIAGHDNHNDHGIHIDSLDDIDSSVIFTQTVDQRIEGDGNQFNVQQINNLVDNDKLDHASVKFEGAGWGGDFKIDSKLEGGDVKVDDADNTIEEFGNLSAPVSADAISTVSAFTQNIVMGANIQFNSNSINAAVGNVSDDDHTL